MYPTITREDLVAQFHKAAETKTQEEGGSMSPFFICFAEELEEFSAAMADYVLVPNDENRENLVKEWADVQYTLSGLAYYFGIDGQIAFNRVAQNNLTKVVDGKVIRREDGKVLKPEGYVKPDMKGL